MWIMKLIYMSNERMSLLIIHTKKVPVMNIFCFLKVIYTLYTNNTYMIYQLLFYKHLREGYVTKTKKCRLISY